MPIVTHRSANKCHRIQSTTRYEASSRNTISRLSTSYHRSNHSNPTQPSLPTGSAFSLTRPSSQPPMQGLPPRSEAVADCHLDTMWCQFNSVKLTSGRGPPCQSKQHRSPECPHTQRGASAPRTRALVREPRQRGITPWFAHGVMALSDACVSMVLPKRTDG